MKNFSSRPDQNGSFGAIPLSDMRDVRVLAANTAETHTIPTGAKVVILTPLKDHLYVKNGVTPTVPAVDVTDGSGPLCIPIGQTRILEIGDWTDIRMISELANIVGMEFFA